MRPPWIMGHMRLKNFVSAMMEPESDHNSSSGSIASDDLMEVEQVCCYVQKRLSSKVWKNSAGKQSSSKSRTGLHELSDLDDSETDPERCGTFGYVMLAVRINILITVFKPLRFPVL